MSKQYRIQDDGGNVVVAPESIANGKAAYDALDKLNDPKFFVATSHDGKPFERVSPHYFEYRGHKHAAFKDDRGAWRVRRLDCDGYYIGSYPHPHVAEHRFIASQEAVRVRHEEFCARQDAQAHQAAHGESHAQQSPLPQEAWEDSIVTGMYKVSVVGFGYMYYGTDQKEANRVFETYSGFSQDNLGDCAGKQVTLYKDGKVQRQHLPQPVEQQQEGDDGFVAPQVARAFRALQAYVKTLRDAALRDARSHCVLPADVEVYYHDKGRAEAYNCVLQFVEITLEAGPSKQQGVGK